MVYVVSGAVASIDARSFDTMGRWMLIQIVMTIVIAPALMANVFTKEYELRNVDMLRMTLLRPREMILGKLFAGYVSVVPLVAAAVLSCAPLIALGARNWMMLGVGYATLVICVNLSLGLTLTASLFTRRTAAALVLSYLLSVVVFIGLWFVAAALGADEEFASLLSPVGAYIRTADLGYWVSPFNAGRAEAVRLESWLYAMGVWTAVTAPLIAASIVLFTPSRVADRCRASSQYAACVGSGRGPPVAGRARHCGARQVRSTAQPWSSMRISRGSTPMMPSPSRSAGQLSQDPQAASTARKSAMPTTPSQLRSPGRGPPVQTAPAIEKVWGPWGTLKPCTCTNQVPGVGSSTTTCSMLLS